MTELRLVGQDHLGVSFQHGLGKTLQSEPRRTMGFLGASQLVRARPRGWSHLHVANRSLTRESRGGGVSWAGG